MARPDKVAKVEMIRDKFLDHQVIFLTDFTGLTVDEIGDLRSRLRDKGAEYRVLKNTLTRLAIKDTDYAEMDKFFVGPVAAAFTNDQPVLVAKELVNFNKENPNLKIKGGFMEGRLLEPAAVRNIATLPSREVLLARLVGSLQSPLFGLHNVLSGPCRRLVYALQAVAEAKADAA